MKIVIIGTINKDIILPFQGSSIQSIGGIYYSMAALSKIAGDKAQIYPISYLGKDLYDAFINLLKQYPNIHSEGLVKINQKNHEVLLEYQTEEERIEKAFFHFPSLEWHHIDKFLEADFYLVNMITGWDISLNAFNKLSERHYNRIFLDVHFLMMGLDKLGKRVPRRPKNILEWIHGARFIQMNEREFEIIAKKPMSEITFFEKFLNPDQVLIITLGSKGSQLLFLKNGVIRKKHFNACKLDRIVDATGCGDVFGAGFVWKYLETQNLYEAMEFATRAAGANCLIKGTTEMDKLLSYIESLKIPEKPHA